MYSMLCSVGYTCHVMCMRVGWQFVAESGVVLIPVEPEDKVSASGGRTSSKKMAGSKVRTY